MEVHIWHITSFKKVDSTKDALARKYLVVLRHYSSKITNQCAEIIVGISKLT